MKISATVRTDSAHRLMRFTHSVPVQDVRALPQREGSRFVTLEFDVTQEQRPALLAALKAFHGRK